MKHDRNFTVNSHRGMTGFNKLQFVGHSSKLTLDLPAYEREWLFNRARMKRTSPTSEIRAIIADAIRREKAPQ